MAQVILSYDNVLKDSRGKGALSLLLGNGFSMLHSEGFSYRSLLGKMVDSGLSDTAKLGFEAVGSENVELVIRTLRQFAEISKIYRVDPKFRSEVEEDIRDIISKFASAISVIHPKRLTPEEARGVRKFFASYSKIFTTNYDLMMYWSVLRNYDLDEISDGFGPDFDGLPSRLIFKPDLLKSDSRLLTMYFLHGGLHIHEEADGRVSKLYKSSDADNLLASVVRQIDRGDLPLIVTEGDGESKSKRVYESEYLAHCIRSLARVNGSLVVFGHSLSAQDSHICDAIAKNINLTNLYVSMYDHPEFGIDYSVESAAKNIQERRKAILKRMPIAVNEKVRREISVQMFDSSTATVWAVSSKMWLYPLLFRVQRLRWRLLRPVTLGMRVALVRDGEVLLVRHTYLPGWYFPGGGLKSGESLDAAARREAREEVGATLGSLTLVGMYHNMQEHKSDHVALFRCHDFTLDPTASPSPEIAEARFFPLDTPPPDTNPGTRRRIAELALGEQAGAEMGQW